MSAVTHDLGSDGETHWHEERRAIVVNAAGVGLAVAAYGVERAGGETGRTLK